MSKEILAQFGGKIELALLQNGSISATLIGGKRALMGNGSTTEAALANMVKESLIVAEEPQHRVWGLSVINSPNNLPACVVLYSLDSGAELYFTREGANGELAAVEMSQADADAALDAMQKHLDDGDIIVTYNGVKNELKTLAEAADRPKLSKVAMQIHDIAFQMYSMRGFQIAFSAACAGMHVEYTPVADITSSSWGLSPSGAVDAATNYLTALVMLWENIIYLGKVVEWTAKTGRQSKFEFGRMMTVKDSLALPEPDTRWMDKQPAPRTDSLKWMRLE